MIHLLIPTLQWSRLPQASTISIGHGEPPENSLKKKVNMAVKGPETRHEMMKNRGL
jgi:hypothetical protein